MFWEKTFYSSSNGFIGKVFCIFVISVCLTVQFVYSQTIEPKETSEATNLELNKPIEREISGEQTHLYKIKIPAKQFVKIDVEQRGIDVVVNLLGESDDVITRYARNPKNTGVEEIIMTSDVAGDYQISISPGQKFSRIGRYEVRILELRNATEKELAVDEARRLYTKAISVRSKGNYDGALEIAERIVKIWEKFPNEEHIENFAVYKLLGIIYTDKAFYDKAESALLKAIELSEKTFGKNSLPMSGVLDNLGDLYSLKSDYPKTEEIYLRLLEIREKELDPNHILIAGILNSLGSLSLNKGDEEKATDYYQRALKVYEEAVGPDNRLVAFVLNNIANIYKRKDIEKAEKLYYRALVIFEKEDGADHLRTGQLLFGLANLHRRKGEFEKAKKLAQRALIIFETKLGEEHPYTSYALSFLAYAHELSEEYNEAEALYKRSVAIRQKTQGKFHPALGSAYQSLASLYIKKDEIDKAVDAQLKVNEIFEYNVGLNLSVGSEREKLNYIKTLSEFENITLAMNFQVGAKSQTAINLAATTVLQRKGRVLDAMSDSLGILRRRSNKQDQKLLDDLNETTKELVGFVLGGPKKLNADEFEQKVKELEERRENFESQVSRQSAGFYTQTKPIKLETVRKILPKQAILLEFSIYQPLPPSNDGKEIIKQTAKEKEPRYVVYGISSENEVWGKELGSVKEINEAIASYRQALNDPKRKDVKELGRSIDNKLFKPIRELLGDTTQVFISPDGQLNLIPFEALVDEKGKFLIESYSFNYLGSGRDLLRMQVARESKSKPVLVANPLFGESNSVDETVARNAKRQSITATRDMSETYFAPLDGTKQEGESIKTLFPQATFLTDGKATETALKQVASPSILHIATHGFFLEDIEDEPKNPLLRSGLAFAGANQRKSGEDDGILTALEASGLNLWGTKLVVLSACDTGLGEVKNGEGVYGLRRAFTLAGTESLVMSMWSVSDFVTRELMTEYYTNLKSGMGRNKALREVQLKMIKKKNRQHPFYWASFIQSGEWANLEGKR